MDYKTEYEKLLLDLRTYFEQRTKLMNEGKNLPKFKFEKLFREHSALDQKLRKKSGANSKNGSQA